MEFAGKHRGTRADLYDQAVNLDGAVHETVRCAPLHLEALGLPGDG
ncbi:hypothetical protein C4J92_1795 [Pseudomonas sp. R3-18-08]|nr:hypothetical protein C4J92_1795 [Pseudomonas sp. R3-18-08]